MTNQPYPAGSVRYCIDLQIEPSTQPVIEAYVGQGGPCETRGSGGAKAEANAAHDGIPEAKRP